MEAALAAAALSFLFLLPPSSSATFGASYAGYGSSRRSESLFAAPAARNDHQEGASRFRGAGACSAQWSPTSSSSGHVADLSLVLRRTWALACAQAVKPPVPTPGLHLQQQRAARGGCWCWWYVACGLADMWHAGLRAVVRGGASFFTYFRCGATVAAFS